MFAIVIKSYFNDLNRADRLVKSITEHNRDELPVYVIVPKVDTTSFRERLGDQNINYLEDDDILQITMRFSGSKKIELPPVTMQQVVKSEFWRLDLAENYLIIDF